MEFIIIKIIAMVGIAYIIYTILKAKGEKMNINPISHENEIDESDFVKDEKEEEEEEDEYECDECGETYKSDDLIHFENADIHLCKNCIDRKYPREKEVEIVEKIVEKEIIPESKIELIMEDTGEFDRIL